MKKILSLLYPHVCPFCGNIEVEKICKKCQKKLIYIQEPRCKKCGKPIGNVQKEYCRDCEERIKNGICWFEEGRSLWVHRPPVSYSVYQFKFQNRRVYASFYAEEWQKYYGGIIRRWKIELLVPIPMTRKKERKRGYNQAYLLAKELSKDTGIPVAKNGLKRIRTTKAQKTLSKDQRKKNPAGSFRASEKMKWPESVLIVDDIYTTGNTVNEAAKTLKNAGVRNVFFLTISIGQDI